MNIGQTRRSVETRIKKHHRFAWLGHPDNSAVAEHTFNRHHLIKFLKPRPSVIYAASKSGWRLSLHPPKQYLQRGWPNFESHANLFWVLSVLVTNVRPFKDLKLRPPLPRCNGSSIQRLSSRAPSGSAPVLTFWSRTYSHTSYPASGFLFSFLPFSLLFLLSVVSSLFL
jgi:hypothetical protein